MTGQTATSVTSESFLTRWQQVQQRIAQACQHAGRQSQEITLIAVSKTHPADSVRSFYELGQRIFGENYLQEALDKMTSLADLSDIEWHYMGRIQSNKTRLLSTHFDWVHSLASLDHARRLHEQRPMTSAPLKVCIEVNVSTEDSKEGIAPSELGAFLTELQQYDRLQPVGLMAIPAPAEDFEAQRRPCRLLRELRDQLATPERPLPVLSMGMTNDLEAAILEGATHIRIGTALFGPRHYPETNKPHATE